MNQNLSTAINTPLQNAPTVQAAQQFFQSQVAPEIQNRASMAGLGRSTATTNALAAGEANAIVPLINAEQSRRDALINQGMQVGDVSRQVQQQTYNAAAQDALRRQALSEEALFGVLGQLPSTIGQRATTTTSSK